MPTNSTPMKRKSMGVPLMNMKVKIEVIMAIKYGQSRGASDYVHRQSCDGGKKRNVQKTATHTDERSRWQR